MCSCSDNVKIPFSCHLYGEFARISSTHAILKLSPLQLIVSYCKSKLCMTYQHVFMSLTTPTRVHIAYTYLSALIASKSLMIHFAISICPPLMHHSSGEMISPFTSIFVKVSKRSPLGTQSIASMKFAMSSCIHNKKKGDIIRECKCSCGSLRTRACVHDCVRVRA